MTAWRLIGTEDTIAWDEELVTDHDVYHLCAYNKVDADRIGGTARLFVHESGGHHSLLPLIVRGIDGTTAEDAISAYGYPGAVTTAPPGTIAVQTGFEESLTEALGDLGVVSLFVRQHPFFATDWLFGHAAKVIDLGSTVAVDLARSEAEIRNSANQNHRRNLKKADALGFELIFDPEFRHLDRFIEIYESTMHRTEAPKEYFFAPSYYAALRDNLGDAAGLFHAVVDGKIVSSLIAFHHGDLVQYHLGGTDDGWSRHGASRWLLEQVRIWAKAEGYQWFHLGGGVGAREDSLFRFKAGFSPVRRTYRVVQWIQDAQRYRQLIAARRERAEPMRPGFFPEYRA